jgi:hypothetical protein
MHLFRFFLFIFTNQSLVFNPPFIIYIAAAYSAAVCLHILRSRASSSPPPSSSFSRAFSPDHPPGAVLSSLSGALIGSSSVFLGRTAVGLMQNAILPHPQVREHHKPFTARYLLSRCCRRAKSTRRETSVVTCHPGVSPQVLVLF